MQPKVMELGGHLVTFDQCRYGLQTSSGEYMRKRTCFLTNSDEIRLEFDKKMCNDDHVHAQIEGYDSGARMSLGFV
jgi:hypothetical protein